MNKLIVIFLFFIKTISFAQNSAPHSNSSNGLIEAMILSFENDLKNHYQTKNSESFYLQYIKDIASKKISPENVASDESLELLELSKESLQKYIWITKKERREKESNYLNTTIDYTSMDSITKRYFDQLKMRDHELCVNYYDQYSETIINNSKNNNAKRLIDTFRELTDYDYYLTATAFTVFNENDITRNSLLKTFVVFELYYAPLILTMHHE